MDRQTPGAKVLLTARSRVANGTRSIVAAVVPVVLQVMLAARRDRCCRPSLAGLELASGQLDHELRVRERAQALGELMMLVAWDAQASTQLADVHGAFLLAQQS
jgi:hypothetical protein